MSSPGALMIELSDEQSLYSSPEMGSTIIRILPSGTHLLWNGIVRRVTNVAFGVDGSSLETGPDHFVSTWFQVGVDEIEGWIMSLDDHFVEPYSISKGAGKSAQIRLVSPAWLYQSPGSNGTVVGKVWSGTLLTVIDKPVTSGGYAWWRVKVNDQYQGWIPDMTNSFTVVVPTADHVKKYPICDEFSFFPVSGWESIADVLQNDMPSSEEILCAGGVDLKSDGTPFAVVVSFDRNEQDPGASTSVIRIFERVDSLWKPIYRDASALYPGIDRVGVYDLTGDSKPALVYTSSMLGSGAIMNTTILKYDPSQGLRKIFEEGGIYKGGFQAGVGSFVLIGRYGREGFTNCCLNGIYRLGYVWEHDHFVQVVADELVNPKMVGELKDIDIHPLEKQLH